MCLGGYERLLSDDAPEREQELGSTTTPHGTRAAATARVRVDVVQRLRMLKNKKQSDDECRAFEKEITEKFRLLGRPHLPSRVGLKGGPVRSLAHVPGEQRVFAALENGDLVASLLNAYTVADVLLPEATLAAMQRALLSSLPDLLGGLSPLHAAALLDSPANAEVLVGTGRGLWRLDAHGRTALEYAL